MIMERLNYIDGLKGFAIVSVILLHAFPIQFLHKSFAFIHIWQAIPLFVFISFLLIFYKMDISSFREYYCWKRWKSLFRRIIYPFIFVEIIIVFTLLYKRNWEGIIHLLFYGGIGKGSYYPYLYLQIWVVTPIIWWLLRKYRVVWVAFYFVIISVLLNFLFIDMPGRIYSCFFIRYLFMAIISFMWYKNIKKNRVLVLFVLPMISIIYWVLLEAKIINLNHLVPDWESQQFPSFFFTYLFVYLFFMIYSKTSLFKLKSCFEWLGKNSYEIFLMQMLFFYFCPLNILCFNNSLFNRIVVYPCLALFGSIIPVYFYRKSLLFCKSHSATKK